ncbi:hypothetical protein AA042_09830 [Pseudomonas lundensis]|uniref:Uncharacterized protein n=1 Tax=Pseudomonas lundensis TaxID=86185 RepID=A0ABX4GQN6_9PSED|nr:hypothetical protein AA042_09830 [Pseudomonas lundensis]OZY46811.1 hypothetical protein CJF41_06695 [Pseudomonas lundensis]OZY56474.1 hypothetical protein CJF38_05270 [Pseudomonas lundensis]
MAALCHKGNDANWPHELSRKNAVQPCSLRSIADGALTSTRPATGSAFVCLSISAHAPNSLKVEYPL